LTCHHNKAGDLATATDPLSNPTTRTYDVVSRLLTSTEPLGRLTWYTYNVLNYLSAVTDPCRALPA
jgi:YD repeat-containing protein